MPTEKPRVTFTLSDDQFEALQEFRYSGKYKNQTQAVLALLNKGLALVVPETKKAPGLSPEAQKFARQYDELDAHGKKVVASLLADEVERMMQEQEPPKPETKIIPLLGTSAAAGVGEPDTGLDFTPYEVPADSKGEFAVRITGDSMEPHLHDGDIALCLKRDPEIGEVAVMMINGALLVKQYITDGYNIYLRSLNRKRRDCDYDIWGSGSDTVRCYGTVIMPKIPLVQQ